MTERTKATGGVIVGGLIAALTAGAIFWARSVDNNLRGMRSEISQLNRDLGLKLDQVIEFRGAALMQLRMHDERLDRVEERLSRSSAR